MPYYVDNYPDLHNGQVRIFIKYNNDNNPFYIATITPVTVFGGLTKIGGYITIFGLLKIALYLYNRHSFENKLLKKYRRRIAETLDDADPGQVDKNTIRELMSYEMLMQLVLNYLKEQKEFRLSEVTKEGRSEHSIQRETDEEPPPETSDQHINAGHTYQEETKDD